MPYSLLWSFWNKAALIHTHAYLSQGCSGVKLVIYYDACSKETIHLTLDHLSAGRNNMLDHLGAGRNEKYIGFPIPLTITKMLLLCYFLRMVQVFLRGFSWASPREYSQENLNNPSWVTQDHYILGLNSMMSICFSGWGRGQHLVHIGVDTGHRHKEFVLIWSLSWVGQR